MKKSILLAKPRVSWTHNSWKSLPPSPCTEDDKAEIHKEPANLKRSSHTCLAGKNRGERVRKSWGQGSRVIKQDLPKDKFYGE